MAPLFFNRILLFAKALSGLYLSKRSVISWKYCVWFMPSCFAPQPAPSSQSRWSHPSSFPSVYEFDVQWILSLSSPVMYSGEYTSAGGQSFQPVRGLIIDWRCLINLGLAVSGSAPQNSLGTPFELPALQNIGAHTNLSCMTSLCALANAMTSAKTLKYCSNDIFSREGVLTCVPPNRFYQKIVSAIWWFYHRLS